MCFGDAIIGFARERENFRPVPWWCHWFEPIVPVTIIIALFTGLVTGGMAVFQFVKGDTNAVETRAGDPHGGGGGRQARPTGTGPAAAVPKAPPPGGYWPQ